jgi:hypothetical protein
MVQFSDNSECQYSGAKSDTDPNSHTNPNPNSHTNANAHTDSNSGTKCDYQHLVADQWLVDQRSAAV